MYTRNGGAAKNKRARNYNNVSILCLHVECGDMQCNPPCRLAICCSPPCTPPAAASHSILACVVLRALTPSYAWLDDNNNTERGRERETARAHQNMQHGPLKDLFIPLHSQPTKSPPARVHAARLFVGWAWKLRCSHSLQARKSKLY